MAKYFKANKEEMTKMKNALGSGKWFKPKDGKNQIRILPPWSKEGKWAFALALHYGFKDEEGRDRAHPCMKQWKGVRCPACDMLSLLKKVDGAEKIVEKMNPKTKYYVNLIDRKVGDDKVFIYGLSAKLLNEILAYDDDEDYGNVTDPEEGYDFVLEKTGSGLTTRYAIRIKPKTTAAGDFEELFNLDEEVPNDISVLELAQLCEKQFGDMVDGFNVKDYKSTAAKSKVVEEEDEEEEEEPKPKAKKSAAKAKK